MIDRIIICLTVLILSIIIPLLEKKFNNQKKYNELLNLLPKYNCGLYNYEVRKSMASCILRNRQNYEI